MGLEFARPLKGPFLGRDAARAFWSILVCGSYFPFLWLFAAVRVSRRPSRCLTPKWARKQVVSPALWGSALQGWRFLRGGTKTSSCFWRFWCLFWATGAQEPFCLWGGGLLRCPLGPRLSHALSMYGIIVYLLLLRRSVGIEVLRSLSLRCVCRSRNRRGPSCLILACMRAAFGVRWWISPWAQGSS